MSPDSPGHLLARGELPGSRRLRFAPSPTGQLHVGNVRTALLSYCLTGIEGRFLLRIEDTDRERYLPEAVPEYLKTLAWLGLAWDEGPDIGGPCGPYVESERLSYYRAAADRLLEVGTAYPCFCSRERLEELRAAQRAAGLPTRYDGRCRALTEAQAKAAVAGGADHVIRLRMPPGQSRWTDLVLGPQEFQNEEIDDQVLIKSDGFPTYHLAQVVDDHLMGITHVIRGVDWVPSTPKHLAVYGALGWDPPALAHVPLVLGPDHKKLAKRHGAMAVSEYREMGYLPEALVNFLAFLGWSPGTEEEVFSLAELRARMGFERLQSSPAVFDQQRLDYLNGVWIRRLSVPDLAARLREFLPQAREEQLPPIAAMVQERIRRLDEVPSLLEFAFTEPMPQLELLCGRLEPDAARQFLELADPLLDGDLGDLMERLKEAAAGSFPEDAKQAKQHFKECMQVLRVAITGQRISPPLPESISLIGNENAHRRIARAIERLTQRS
ncbi:MAG: glutamate--tRNA ligase [Candidatus Dormibacteria bacterium]